MSRILSCDKPSRVVRVASRTHWTICGHAEGAQFDYGAKKEQPPESATLEILCENSSVLHCDTWDNEQSGTGTWSCPIVSYFATFLKQRCDTLFEFTISHTTTQEREREGLGREGEEEG